MPTSDAGAIGTAAVSSGGYAPGETATFDLRVKNEGAQPVENANIRVMLAKIEEGDGYSTSGQYAYLDTIPPAGGESVVKLSYTVNTSDVGNEDLRIVAMATIPVPGKQPMNVTCESEPIPITSVLYRLAAKLEITNRGSGANYAFTTGDTIQGTLTVTNESTTALSGIRVAINPAVNISGDAFTLQQSEEKQLPFTYRVTEEDMLAQELSFTATASCTETSATDTIEVELEELRYSVHVDGRILNQGTYGEGLFITGDTVSYEFTVTNTSNVSLRNVSANIEIVTPSGFESARFENLAVGETYTSNMSYIVTAADVGEERNISASIHFLNNPDGRRIESNSFSMAVPMAPRIQQVKTEVKLTSSQDEYDVGDRITWDVIITNVGTVPVNATVSLTGALLTSPGRYGDKQNMLSLPYGGSVTWGIYHIVTEEDAANTEYKATIAATDGTITTAPVKIAQPRYSLDLQMALTNKGTGTGGAFREGETPEGTITLTNTGNRDLVDLLVSVTPTDTELTNG